MPGFLLEGGSTQTYFGLLDAVKDAGSQVIPPTDRRIGLSDASLQVIPPPGDESLGNNDNSVGVIVLYGDFDAAMTGDAEPSEFAWWLANVPELLKPVEVYKAAHHGSPNGDSPNSIETFDPKTVVISVGLDNAYGHPSAEALALYNSVGAKGLPERLARHHHCHGQRRWQLSGTTLINADPSVPEVATPAPSDAEEQPTSPTSSSPTYDPFGPNRDCGDFSTQVEAQAFFEAAGGPADDPHRLDSGGDGQVCESLP